MWAFRRSSDLLAAALGLWAGAACAGAPGRVVSMNLCTDQLALMLAAPGQLVSVSSLAQDPMVSSMAAEAAGLPANHGLAEEIFLMKPDLVLAGTFTRPQTVDLLRRLGVRVELFAPETSLADIRANILAMGAALGREPQAEALARQFEADLAAVTEAVDRRPRAALYYANGYTTGEQSLAGDILTAAGFRNIAAELGLPAGGVLALERLILAQPEAIISGRRYPGRSRSEEILDHPALAALRESAAAARIEDADWICGTPRVLRAIAGMVRLRRSIE